MKKYLKGLILISFGILIAFPLFSVTYFTMVRTSTPEFCASCHEIRFAVDTWKTSTHVNNAHGFVADCMDCHLPAPQDTINFFKVGDTVSKIKKQQKAVQAVKHRVNVAHTAPVAVRKPQAAIQRTITRKVQDTEKPSGVALQLDEGSKEKDRDAGFENY